IVAVFIPPLTGSGHAACYRRRHTPTACRSSPVPSPISSQDFRSKAINTINQAIQMTDEGALRSELSEHRALFQKKKTYKQPASSN
ncbi:MAG: hypothetical protein ACKOAH_16680, partial [Pirellula sp.]